MGIAGVDAKRKLLLLVATVERVDVMVAHILDPACSAVVGAPLQAELKLSAEHVVKQEVDLQSVEYIASAPVPPEDHWYAPVVVETVLQKILFVVVMGVPTAAAGHVTHEVRIGMGATLFKGHAVTVVAVQYDPAGHGVHRVPPAVAM